MDGANPEPSTRRAPLAAPLRPQPAPRTRRSARLRRRWRRVEPERRGPPPPPRPPPPPPPPPLGAALRRHRLAHRLDGPRHRALHRLRGIPDLGRAPVERLIDQAQGIVR